MTAAVDYNNCNASNNRENHLSSIGLWAQHAGKGVGLVTTTRITHATPAGLYAHVSNREWECDNDTLKYGVDPKQCIDIALQLIEGKPGKDLKVIFGGGRGKLLPHDFKDEEGDFGQRLDGRNLIDEWQQSKKGKAKYVYDRKGLESLNFDKLDYVMGLFESDHLQYNIDANNQTEPTLSEMTVAAIKMLEKEQKGYFLFVEGGKIDIAHHNIQAHKALDETVQFAEAVRIASEMTNREDTLIIVSSDHAHTMTLAGYSDRGTSVIGLNTKVSDIDGLHYSTLSYANGPKHKAPQNQTRVNFPDMNMEDPDLYYPALNPMAMETHGGEDVAVFANGPWSHLFSGAYEQNVIPHLIGYAACLGEGLTACKN